jgi:hypothetical protein
MLTESRLDDMTLQVFHKTLVRAFVLPFLLAGIAWSQVKDKEKSPLNAIGVMSFEEYVKKRHAVPYVLRLSAGKRRLVYFGAKHTYDPNDPQISQIEKWWLSLKPEVAFFEGGDPEASPAIVKSRDEISKNGEPSFVLFLAGRDNVPVHTLEPTQHAEIALLLKTYSPEEVKIFYALRLVPQFKSGKRPETIEAYTKGVLAWLSSKPQLQGKPRTLGELQEISARLFPQLQNWRDVPQDWFDPAQVQTYLNKVSRQLSEFRDLHMLRLLTEQLVQGRRVFAVVGASHVVMQERALRAAIKQKRKKAVSHQIAAPNKSLDASGGSANPRMKDEGGRMK